MTTTAPTPGRAALDVAALDAVETRLVERERRRGELHAAQLRDVLELQRLHAVAGSGVAVEASLALLLGCSEWHGRMLLEQAGLLASLPGGLSAVESGLLSVEGCRAVLDLLAPVDLGPRRRVWDLLLARLERDAAEQAVLPPARLRQVLRRLVLKVDAEGAEARRRVAVRESGLELRRRDDGLVDLLLLGLQPADGQAVVERLDARCRGGDGDDRSAAARRRDTAVDVLLDREPAGQEVVWAPRGCQVTVLVPLATALEAAGGSEVPDASVEPAELVGSGPVLASEPAAVLASEPVLRAVWVDGEGVPVAVAPRTVRPGPGLADVHRALRGLAAEPPPPRRYPRHPDDHDPPDGSPPCAHPAGDPGPYRLPADLRRLIDLRSPRCEWPGCGTRASRCDAEHDVPHPDGPTCACNNGPLCRRHHRVKQTGWVKVRTRDGGVRWSSPTGRVWASPPQHRRDAPAAPVALGLALTDDDLEAMLDQVQEEHARAS